ncbi:Homoserine O-succinyltransferase [Klebsiella pneumoniae]|nr:Homoserine O-succinyltransferase [Klebsiella pneumoniae]
MPIRVPDELPAVNFLREENVFVMTTSRASGQEIRPLKVLILNLMPKKIETENQFLRLLSNSPLQVDIQLLRIDSRESRNTPAEHLNNFYCNFEDIQEQNFDGLIVTWWSLMMSLTGRRSNRCWSGRKITSPRRCLSAGRYRPR